MMILSLSYKEDIPSLSDYNLKQVIQKFCPEAIIFWTKYCSNDFFDQLYDVEVPFYFTYTINNYPTEETGIPSLGKRIKRAKEISKTFGKNSLVIRNDPLFITKEYSLNFHREHFNLLSKEFKGLIEKLTFSFLDPYSKIKESGLRRPTPFQQKHLIKRLITSFKDTDIRLETCAETATNFKEIHKGACVDPRIIKKLTGNSNYNKGRARQECGCVQTTDPGRYRGCINKCTYCYAQ